MIKQTLLTAGNAKIIKGEALGYVTKGIHLAPANLSGYEVCNWRSKGCTIACLNTAGRGQMQNTQDSRIKKTKLFLPSNYHLTFSCSETNSKVAQLVLSMGGNVAVVFRSQLPSTWNGVEVINGDKSDLRFLDTPHGVRRSGVVVGLIEKGLAKKDATGFVQEGINS